ncbi:MAG: hypothetical protein B6I38_02765 [Anaerolineaceae bacterium 4572_5.1]|nr:MAG: hypothetical protein B6I38_02765 [Anaerolineaceae bacterium 4572_5.1]
MTTTYSVPSEHIRPFDVWHDLLPVANLIETSFADKLSREGKALVRNMRSSAKDKRFKRWAVRAAGRVSMPLSGFVWDNDGDVIGNLSFIPFRSLLHHYYLIANVAVHADYQRQGIGSALVKRALQDLDSRNLDGIWLQVDASNQAAIDLYAKIGFQKHARRTTWVRKAQRSKKIAPENFSEEITVKLRSTRHWESQRKWLKRTYPPSLRWYLPLRAWDLRGGVLGMLTRFFFESPRVKQWSATDADGELMGVLSWQSTTTFEDKLWLAASPKCEETVANAFFPFLDHTERFKRSLRLDYPAGKAVSSLEKAGFTRVRTLIWMKLGMKA